MDGQAASGRGEVPAGLLRDIRECSQRLLPRPTPSSRGRIGSDRPGQIQRLQYCHRGHQASPQVAIPRSSTTLSAPGPRHSSPGPARARTGRDSRAHDSPRALPAGVPRIHQRPFCPALRIDSLIRHCRRPLYVARSARGAPRGIQCPPRTGNATPGRVLPGDPAVLRDAQRVVGEFTSVAMALADAAPAMLRVPGLIGSRLSSGSVSSRSQPPPASTMSTQEQDQQPLQQSSPQWFLRLHLRVRGCRHGDPNPSKPMASFTDVARHQLSRHRRLRVRPSPLRRRRSNRPDRSGTSYSPQRPSCRGLGYRPARRVAEVVHCCAASTCRLALPGRVTSTL